MKDLIIATLSAFGVAVFIGGLSRGGEYCIAGAILILAACVCYWAGIDQSITLIIKKLNINDTKTTEE